MLELVRSNDPVQISLLMAMLEEAGIEAVLLDSNMSVLEGSLGILPRRVMILADDLPRAQDVLAELERRDP